MYEGKARGGYAAAAKLSPQQRKERAQNAANARWSKKDLVNENLPDKVALQSQSHNKRQRRPAVGKNMEVTLRKASALSKALLDTSRALPLTKAVKVSIYAETTVAAEVATAETKLATNVVKASALIEAAFGLRKSIGSINASSGIDALLTERASLDSVEKLLAGVGAVSRYTEDETVENLSVAQAQLDALKVRASSASVDALAYRRGTEDALTVAVPAPTVADRLVEIRRRKTDISDQLLVLNMTKKVKVDAATVALLEEFKLV